MGAIRATLAPQEDLVKSVVIPLGVPARVIDPCRRGRDNAADVHHQTKDHHAITREMVLTVVRGHGRYGMTLDEAAAFFGVAANEISGRFTELKKGEEIFETDRKRLTRKGCPAVVLVAGRFSE